MRLLAVSALADIAGGEVTLLRVLPELQQRGWSVELAVPAAGPLEATARASGVPTVTIPLGPPNRRTAAAFAGAVLSLPRLTRANAVWLNGLPTQRLVPSLLASRRRAVLRVNNPLDRAPSAWRRPGFWRAVSAVVADSKSTAEECIAAGAPGERTRVLLPPAWGGPRARGGVSVASQRVGFVGRIEPRKGVLELVQAAAIFLAARPEATLTVIGAPPHGDGGAYPTTVRAAAAASGVGERIEFRGYVPNASTQIEQFDVLAVPSLAEPFGTVAAEAAAAGVPVVASRVGGLVEVVGQHGVLVAPGDPAALAAAIGELLDDPARRHELGEAAAQHADRFDPSTYAEQMDRMLRAAAR